MYVNYSCIISVYNRRNNQEFKCINTKQSRYHSIRNEIQKLLHQKWIQAHKNECKKRGEGERETKIAKNA